MPRVPFLLALLCLPLVVGCEGCRRDTDQAEEDKQEAPLEDFSSRPAQPFPGDANVTSGGIKPGHWLTASQALKSNKVDSRGELHSRASASSSNFRTGETQTAQGEIASIRPIVLPKGQLRRFDYRLLAPVSGNHDQKRTFLASRFVSSGRTVFYDTGKQPFNVLSGEEFFFVVLTTRPERFAKFQTSYWVRPYRDEFAFKSKAANYRIVFPPTEDLLPLSETMLDWTSTAVVLWDNLSPDALTPRQQQAIADWVRFGGALIVNGAAASDAISQTSIADLLPLRPSGNIELDPGAATELLTSWAVANDPSTEKQVAQLKSQSGRVAVDGQAAADAVAVRDSGNLVLVRQVGNGRVVQPRFDVTSDWLTTWGSYDSFVNAILLQRPRRKFTKSADASDESLIVQQYFDHPSIKTDPALNSGFRITARDAVLRTSIDQENAMSVAASRLDPLTYVDSSTGIGGWTESSDAIRLCREILKSESGIEIPDSSLVIRSLGYYLLILVPINYLVFRLAGRLEYAWLAVPLIAVAGAAWVARAARLDIGFARKQTELALLELQPNYHRGHLSRVVAIYNSLSESYDIEFNTVDGVAVPIWDEQAGSEPVFRTSFAEGPSLAGLAVDSNNTQLVHTEQMIDVGGSITLDAQGKLVNQTDYELFDAYVVEKIDKDNVRIATVGPCTPGSEVSLRYRDIVAPPITDELPMQTTRMILRLARPEAMPDRSTRLVARIDTSLPGMTIAPNANQVVSQTVVLAHLKHAPLPEPEKDLNLISEFRDTLRPGNEDSQQDSSL